MLYKLANEILFHFCRNLFKVCRYNVRTNKTEYVYHEFQNYVPHFIDKSSGMK